MDKVILIIACLDTDTKPEILSTSNYSLNSAIDWQHISAADTMGSCNYVFAGNRLLLSVMRWSATFLVSLPPALKSPALGVPVPTLTFEVIDTGG
jgi:hypothetical protein